jgi:NAD(P)-dependent dehydrogenase (short-subunit alcohol dehydrogenase family)
MATLTALVTGANKGIGFTLAKLLAEKKIKVFLGARSAERGNRAVSMLKLKQLDVEFVELDITSLPSIEAAYKAISAKTDRLDILVNNAAVLEDDGRDILTLDPEVVHHSIETNALGPLRVTQRFAPLLIKSGHGRVVNLSSTLGSLTEMTDAHPAYSISKTALNAVTRQLALAFASKKVVVNAVCPGWVATDMGDTPIGGGEVPKEPEEGADTPLWLATEAPLSITGRFLRDRKVIHW